MTLEEVERCLIETFQIINGVPIECLTDNMSSIINHSEHQFTNGFKTFSKDMDFIPKKCKPHSPETKGKDESCNRFMSWLYPYENEFETEDDFSCTEYGKVILSSLREQLEDFMRNLRKFKLKMEINPELEYQIKVQRNKLHSLGINTDDYEYDN